MENLGLSWFWHQCVRVLQLAVSQNDLNVARGVLDDMMKNFGLAAVKKMQIAAHVATTQLAPTDYAKMSDVELASLDEFEGGILRRILELSNGEVIDAKSTEAPRLPVPPTNSNGHGRSR